MLSKRFEAVKPNVIGAQDRIDDAMSEEIEKFTVSTDKAVNPTGVMGATKMLAERLFIIANIHLRINNKIFSRKIQKCI